MSAQSQHHNGDVPQAWTVTFIGCDDWTSVAEAKSHVSLQQSSQRYTKMVIYLLIISSGLCMREERSAKLLKKKICLD